MIQHFLVSNRVNSENNHILLPFPFYDNVNSFVNNCLDGESLIYEYKGLQMAFHLDGGFNTCLKVGITVKNLLGEKASFFLYFHNDVTEKQIISAFMGKNVNGLGVHEVDIFSIKEVLK